MGWRLEGDPRRGAPRDLLLLRLARGVRRRDDFHRHRQRLVPRPDLPEHLGAVDGPVDSRGPPAHADRQGAPSFSHERSVPRAVAGRSADLDAAAVGGPEAGDGRSAASSPITTLQLVLGKYLGALAIMAILFVATMHIPLFLVLGGNVDRGVVFAGYLGVFLTAAMFLAAGVFASSLTENQIVAALLTMATMLGIFLFVK